MISFIIGFVFLLFHYPETVYAQQQVGITPPSGIPAVGVNDLVRFVINVLFFLAFLMALIFLLVGGVRWIISGGDKVALEAARGQIIASIIGLVIVIFSYAALAFIFNLIGLPNITSLVVPSLGNPQQGPFGAGGIPTPTPCTGVVPCP